MEKTDYSKEKTDYSFPKKEKLCNKSDIEELFKKGSSAFLYPYKIFYLHCPESEEFPKVLISIPKKKFKRAVDRNKLRRQIREIYRLHKSSIFFELKKDKTPCYLGIVYLGKEKIPYIELEKKLISILLRLKNINSTLPIS